MLSDLIYDVGMNNGDDTAYYLHRGYRVVAIEAHPELAAAGERRFAREIESGRLTIVNVGVTADGGSMPFWVCESQSEWSSFDRSIASRDGAPHREVTVACRPFDDVLEEFGVPYYLKIDIEGHDTVAVAALDSSDLPQFVSIEAAEIGQLELLRDLGFTGFKCVSQYHFLPLQTPPVREQLRLERANWLRWNQRLVFKFVRPLGIQQWCKSQVRRARVKRDWEFPTGASGPFGDELPGRWMGFQEMYDTYEQAQEKHRQQHTSLFWNQNEYSFWADFHARR